MVLTIEQTRLLEDLQKDFTSAYPYLKIEFFRNGTGLHKTFPTRFLLDKHLAVKDARKTKQTGSIAISDSMTVDALEKALEKEYGLTAQVFRKSGRIWLETTMTDHWTLKQQNDHGQEISMSLPGRQASG